MTSNPTAVSSSQASQVSRWAIMTFATNACVSSSEWIPYGIAGQAARRDRR